MCIGWLAVAVSEVFEVNFSVGNYDMIALQLFRWGDDSVGVIGYSVW